MPRFITGQAFLDWLSNAGVIPENTRRVVIDAAHDTAVIVYVETFGTEEMIKVEPPSELKTDVRIVGGKHA